MKQKPFFKAISGARYQNFSIKERIKKTAFKRFKKIFDWNQSLFLLKKSRIVGILSNRANSFSAKMAIELALEIAEAIVGANPAY